MASCWILLVLPTLLGRSAAAEQILSAVVREGDDAALACPNAAGGAAGCRSAVWTLDNSLDPVTPSERRGVTDSCSLLVRDVTPQDGGVYDCTPPSRNRSRVVLSVVSIVECKSHRFVTLECAVSGGPLLHHVEWRGFEREEGVVSDQSRHFASVSFSTAHPVHAARTYELWRCHVRDNVTAREHVFIYNPKYPVTPTAAAAAASEADRALDGLMVALRAAELLLLVFITVLLFRSAEKKRREQKVVHTPVRFTQAANQVCVGGDGQEVPVNYENV